jgi:hypothetical protein
MNLAIAVTPFESDTFGSFAGCARHADATKREMAIAALSRADRELRIGVGLLG